MSELGPTITELEPTATERLRALLTERGVEWRGGLPTETMVEADGLDLLYVALPDGRVRAFIRNYLTPEQAIAATLGTGACHDTGGTDENGQQVFNCDACGCVLSLYDRDGINTMCTHFIYDYPRFCPACGRKVVDE